MKLQVDGRELKKGAYRCDPALCRERVCCAVFDVAVTREERERIQRLLSRIAEFCPWLLEGEDPFQLTPCEIFIRKREGGLCWFNFRDETGRAWCGIHAAALKAGENPYAWKPLNCALWPFLRDGEDRLTLDEDGSFPCLRHAVAGDGEAVRADPELFALLLQLSQVPDVSVPGLPDSAEAAE